MTAPRRPFSRTLLLPGLAAVALCAPAAALAGPPPKERDGLQYQRVAITGGLMMSSIKTDLRFDADDGTPGTLLSAEDDLGLDNKKLLGRGELMVRVNNRHRVRLANAFLPLTRRANKTLDTPIQFGNNAYIAGDNVLTELDLKLFALSYTYSPIRNEKFEVGLSFGIDFADYNARGAVLSRRLDEREEGTGPAPLFGVDGLWRISKRWYVEGRAQYLKVDFDTFSGKLAQYEANVLYQWKPGVAFSLGYGRFEIDIDSQDVGNSGQFKLTSSGPMLNVRVGF